ncbi:MAG: metallophosphoesterase [Candidatus Njordarchaeum guaymaensis]
MNIIRLRDQKSIEIIRFVMDELKINISPEAAVLLCNLLDTLNLEERKRILNIIKSGIKNANYIVLTIEIILKLLNRTKESHIQDAYLEESKVKSSFKPAKSILDFFSTIQDRKKTEDLSNKSKTFMRIEEKNKRMNAKVLEMRKIEEKTRTKAVSSESAKTNIKLQKDMQESRKGSNQIVIPKPKIIRSPEYYSIIESVDFFREYFISRYNKIRRIFLKKGISSYADLKELFETNNFPVYVIIMVSSKYLAKNGKGGIISGEDPFNTATFYVPFIGNNREKFRHLFLDSIVALRVYGRNGNMFFVDEILFPDIPHIRERHHTDIPLKIAFLSDIHVGSKQFLAEYFDNFLSFINGKSDDPALIDISREIKYIIISGDLVDGIGVYPNQREELEIFDIKDQYYELSKLLSKIPSDKEILLIPGNHDAASKLIPQPPIPKSLSSDILKLKNVTLLGNPSWIDIDGVKILVYHGTGLEYIAAELEMPIDKPTRLMLELLRTRHLVPTWGNIPLAPQKDDILVIDDVPDIFVAGHLHITDIRISKGGVILINPGTFLGLTSWQKQLGIRPTPGLFPVVDLKNYEINLIKCDAIGCELV